MFRQTAFGIFFLTASAFAQAPNSTSPSELAPLFANIWRITSTTPYPNSSSIYIFLRNGTLLETSCVETYRVATWKSDPKHPETIEVTEDGRPAFTATVVAGTARTLSLRQVRLLGDKSARNITLSAIGKERDR